jgi:hypothetical protein
MSEFAKEYSGISRALSTNQPLRQLVTSLLQSQPILGKVMEGGSRSDDFRAIMCRLAEGAITESEAYNITMKTLPEETSPYAGSRRVFPHGWAERLVRIQFSRFYNQAVLLYLTENGQTRCYVPHSSTEEMTSSCSRHIAGSEHSIETLLMRLVFAYEKGDFSQGPKIPDHPHCTHVVAPPRQR